MKIKSLHIKNYRVFDEVRIDFQDYAAIVGTNGAGKSTVLNALNIFFRQSVDNPLSVTELDAEDCHNRNTNSPIEISITFNELSDEAKDDFRDYVRQDELVVMAKAEFSNEATKAQVDQFGLRNVMPAFVPFFDAVKQGKKVPELVELYNGIRESYPLLPKETTKKGATNSLREYEEARPAECELEASSDKFYGFSGGVNLLSKHVQWIYVPAVKDVTKEDTEGKNNALGAILQRTVRSSLDFADAINEIQNAAKDSYQKLLNSEQPKLKKLADAISGRIEHWSNPSAGANLNWTYDEDRSINIPEPTAKVSAREGNFEGNLARFGHGFQRSFLIAILQELVGLEQSNIPTLILGIEEPELYQHPPQIRYLADILEKLSENNSQVFVTTHNPVFIKGKHFDSLRLVVCDRQKSSSNVFQSNPENVAQRLANVKNEPVPIVPDAQKAKLHQALQPQINEIFFAPFIVLCEGIEDIAYFTAWLSRHEYYEQFRRQGVHFVPAYNKSAMLEPLVLCEALQIPHYAIFDADGPAPADGEAMPPHKALHARDNGHLFTLLDGDPNTPFPPQDIVADRYAVWHSCIRDSLKADIDDAVWNAAMNDAQTAIGNPPGNFRKNPYFVGELMNSLLDKGAEFPKLEAVAKKILKPQIWGS